MRLKKSKESKSGTLSVRFDTKVRFKLEMAARMRYTNRSNLILQFCLEGMSTLEMRGAANINFDDFINKVWDLDQNKRLANIKKLAPDLLSYDEEVYLLEKVKK